MGKDSRRRHRFFAFLRFLEGHRQQQNALGDLARDVARDLADDCFCPRHDNARSLTGLRRHLTDIHAAPDEVLATLDRAWHLFEVSGSDPKAPDLRQR